MLKETGLAVNVLTADQIQLSHNNEKENTLTTLPKVILR